MPTIFPVCFRVATAAFEPPNFIKNYLQRWDVSTSNLIRMGIAGLITSRLTLLVMVGSSLVIPSTPRAAKVMCHSTHYITHLYEVRLNPRRLESSNYSTLLLLSMTHAPDLSDTIVSFNWLRSSI